MSVMSVTSTHNCGNIRPDPESMHFIGQTWACPVRDCSAVYITNRLINTPGFFGLVWERIDNNDREQ